MSHELLYTSAPQGLKPGSRGFCTVEMTDGIPPGLVDRLESLSGYRQAFPIHDPRAKHNPVNYSHLIVPAGGRRFHVLSRVADAGQDYTGRSNKLAHHVALEPHERPAGNPAWVLRSPGFSQTTWDGTTRTLPSGRRPPQGTRAPAVCKAWQQAAGDSGWAGVLIASAVEPGAKPVSVIYPAGMDVLPLAEEALALVPGERQWDVTFSTYFTKLPAGVDCQWRFVLDDSPEAQALRRNPHAVSVDLCKPLGSPTPTPYVDAAREGRIVAVEARAPERADSVFRRASAAPGAPPPAPVANGAKAAAPPAMDTIRPASGAAGPAIPPSLDSLLGQSGKRSNRTLIITAVIGVAVVAGGVSVAIFLAGPSRGPELVDGSERIRQHTRSSSPPQVPSQSAAEQEAEREAERQRVEAEREATRQRLQQAAAGPKEDPPEAHVAANDHQPMPMNVAPVDVPEPLRDIKQGNRPRVGEYPLLELPVRDFSLTGPRGLVKLAKIYAASPQECDLTIAGSEIALGSGRQFRIERRDEGGARIWDVETFTPNALDHPTIGTFRLSGKGTEFELTFAWASGTDQGADAQMLRYCLLNVHVGGDVATCALAAPERVAKIRLDLDNRLHREQVKLEIPRMADKHVGLDLWFQPGDGLPARILGEAGRGGPGGGHAGAPQRERGGGEELRRRGLEVGGERPLFQVLLGKEEGGGQGQRPSKFRCVVLNVGFWRDGDRLQVAFETLAFPRGFGWKQAKPPTYQFFESENGEIWNRAAFEEYRTVAAKNRASLKNEQFLRAFNEEIRRRSDNVKGLQQFPGPQLEAARRDLESWQRAKKTHDEAIKFTEDAEKWCDEMLAFFDQIERELRIGYRVYIVVEGQEIELVRTVDGESRSASEGLE